MTKQTLVGYVIGLIIVIASIARWFVIYNDPSQAALGCACGLLLIAFSYVYQSLFDLNEKVKDLNEGLDTFNLWVRDEFDKINKK